MAFQPHIISVSSDRHSEAVEDRMNIGTFKIRSPRDRNGVGGEILIRLCIPFKSPFSGDVLAVTVG